MVQGNIATIETQTPTWQSHDVKRARSGKCQATYEDKLKLEIFEVVIMKLLYHIKHMAEVAQCSCV